MWHLFIIIGIALGFVIWQYKVYTWQCPKCKHIFKRNERSLVVEIFSPFCGFMDKKLLRCPRCKIASGCYQVSISKEKDNQEEISLSNIEKETPYNPIFLKTQLAVTLCVYFVFSYLFYKYEYKYNIWSITTVVICLYTIILGVAIRERYKTNYYLLVTGIILFALIFCCFINKIMSFLGT